MKDTFKSVDLILLSHCDILNLGGLVYIVKKFELDVPIICTTPVYKMGQKCLYDAYESKRNEEDFNAFNLDDVGAISASSESC